MSHNHEKERDMEEIPINIPSQQPAKQEMKPATSSTHQDITKQKMGLYMILGGIGFIVLMILLAMAVRIVC